MMKEGRTGKCRTGPVCADSLSHTMLSFMRFHRAVEIAACGMSSNLSSAGRKYFECTSQNFTTFYIGEGIASGKHVAQTADQSAQTT